MKISVVTISFNQAQYLEACIDSVAAQEGPWEHIIVDPGSIDGSREIIKRREKQFSHIILEPDNGPADGLNKGFAKATGEIFFFLNSDDYILPNAFEKVRRHFSNSLACDVVAGHGYVVDGDGKKKRKVWSDKPSRLGLAVGASILIQQSTYFKSAAFHAVGGFNVSNRINWDGELFLEMFLAGQRSDVMEDFISCFRIHGSSITGAGDHGARVLPFRKLVYKRITGREMGAMASFIELGHRAKRLVNRPAILRERLTKGHILSGSR